MAVEDLTRILELSDDIEEIADCYGKRAISHEHLGLPEALVKDLDWLVENGFGTTNIYSWRGLYRHRAGDFEAAARDYEEAYKLSPDSDNSLLQRAISYYFVRRYEEAVQDFTTILESFENAPLYRRAVYMWRGRAFFKLGKEQEALNDFNEERRIMSDSPFSSAVAYMRKHFPEDIEGE